MQCLKILSYRCTHKWKWKKWYTNYVRVCVKTLTNINRKTDKADTHYIQVHTWINRTNRDAIKYVYAYINLLTFDYIIRTRTGSSTQMYENVWINARTKMYEYVRIYTRKRCHNNDVKWCHNHTYAKIYFISFSICNNDVLLR